MSQQLAQGRVLSPTIGTCWKVELWLWSMSAASFWIKHIWYFMQQMGWPMDQMFQGCFTACNSINFTSKLVEGRIWGRIGGKNLILLFFFGVLLHQSIDIMKLQPVSHIATGIIPFRKPFGGWVHNQSPTIEQPITHIITISLFH